MYLRSTIFEVLVKGIRRRIIFNEATIQLHLQSRASKPQPVYLVRASPELRESLAKISREALLQEWEIYRAMPMRIFPFIEGPTDRKVLKLARPLNPAFLPHSIFHTSINLRPKPHYLFPTNNLQFSKF